MDSSSYSCCNSDKGVRFLDFVRIVLISGPYFACFCVRACSGWQDVNSMNCSVRGRVCEGSRVL